MAFLNNRLHSTATDRVPKPSLSSLCLEQSPDRWKPPPRYQVSLYFEQCMRCLHTKAFLYFQYFILHSSGCISDPKLHTALRPYRRSM